MAQIINTLGLIFDIVGALLLFKYGFPQPSFDEGVGLALEDNTVLEDGTTAGQYSAMTRASKESYISLSRFGRSLIIAGFILQIIATWL